MITNRIHNTKDGESLLVAQMDTSHIMNTIRMVVRKLYEVVVRSEKKYSRYEMKLYNTSYVSPEETAARVQDGLEWLSPYFFEAFFRMDEVFSDEDLCATWLGTIENLKYILKRESALSRDIPALPASIEAIYAPETENDFDDITEGDFEPFSLGDIS